MKKKINLKTIKILNLAAVSEKPPTALHESMNRPLVGAKDQVHYHKEEQRGPLLGANKYTHILYIKYIYMCIYIIYLFETIVSKAWPPPSVFFKIINIIFHGFTISWILKVFRFTLVS